MLAIRQYPARVYVLRVTCPEQIRDPDPPLRKHPRVMQLVQRTGFTPRLADGTRFKYFAQLVVTAFAL